MKVELRKVLQSFNVLTKLMEADLKDIKTAYFLSKVYKNDILKEINSYQDFRKKIVEGYSEKDENGKPIIIKEEYKLTEDNKILLNEELNKLELQEIELNIDKIKLEKFDLSKGSVKPNMFFGLDWLIEE